jgi:glycosyltransferase involved in cell wall biosynthesis
MAYGVPVIATDLGALRERIAKYSVGYLVPHENPVPRTVKIIEDFIDYPEVLNYFQQRCAIASKGLPNINEMVMKYVELYKG